MNREEAMMIEKRALMPTYKRQSLLPLRGEGVWLEDDAGDRYLDFFSGIGVTVAGHSHPRIVEAVQEQIGRLAHVSNLYYNEPMLRLADRLHTLTGMKAFFANSGAEAVEGAIKLARHYQLRHKGPEAMEILSAERSFHGRTYGALSATHQAHYQEGFGPLLAGFVPVPYGDLAAMEEAIGPQTAAILVEPVQGEGGVRPASREYLRGLWELAQRHALLLIFDEVQAGLGRTGSLFAGDPAGVVPHIRTLAKALGGGLPIGAMLALPEVADSFAPGDHASTFGGNPVSCRAALEVLDLLAQPGFLEGVKRLGSRVRSAILEAGNPLVAEVRGAGLMIGVVLKKPLAGRVVEAARERRLLIGVAGAEVVRLLPALILTEAEAEEGLDRLLGALADVAKEEQVSITPP